jgi:hypothetical protein
MRIPIVTLLGLVTLLTTTQALAQGQDPAQGQADVPVEPAHAQAWPSSTWRIEAGYRGSYIPDEGFDPFSKDDFLPQLSLSASRTVWTRGRLSFAPGLAWDHGSRSSTARGAATSLSLDRVTIPLEGRLHVDRWGYAFVRLAPGVVAQGVRVEEVSGPAPYTKSRALFAADLSAGYAFPLWRLGGPASPARAWLQADGGYGWVASERLALAPDLAGDDPLRTRGVDLGSIATRGAFFRVGVALTF